MDDLNRLNPFNNQDHVYDQLLKTAKESREQELKSIKSNKQSTSSRILTSISSNKQHVRSTKLQQNFFRKIERIVSEAFGYLGEAFSSLFYSSNRPKIKEIISNLKPKSGLFTKKQRKYLSNMEGRFFPQQLKTKTSYELIEHQTSQMNFSTCPEITLKIDGQSYSLLNGTNLTERYFVHATKMSTAPLILNDTKKFFNNNIKFSISLFENGKSYFHSNDPCKAKAGTQIPENPDFYIALAMSIDSRNIYRSHPDDVGTPTYNRDPKIETKGGNDPNLVEAHIKANTLLASLGAYLQDLQQRCYLEIKKSKPDDPDDPDAYYPSAYSDTTRQFRLENLRSNLGWNKVDLDLDLQKVDLDLQGEKEKLRIRCGHESDILSDYEGSLMKGRNIHNFHDQYNELKHLASKLSPELNQEINNLHDLLKELYALSFSYHKSNQRKHKFIKIKNTILTPLYYLFPSTVLRFYPYHLRTFQSHRFVPLLGPTEIFNAGKDRKYNEFEALSHQKSKEIGARPIEIKFACISKIAFEKLQNKIQENDQDVIKQFINMHKSLSELGLKLLIVDTA